MPRIYRCLKHKPHVLLSYRKKTADTTLYAPNTTWASGRNRLIEYVKANQLLYDYYVFLDEDVVFYEMTQKDGFEMFLSILASCGYPIVVPRARFYNAKGKGELLQKRYCGILPGAIIRKCPENRQWEFQTVDWFDGMFNAFSREAFFDCHLLPYDEKFDAQSWGTSGLINFLRANHRYRNRIMQCNKLWVRSLQHSDYPKADMETWDEGYRRVLGQFGVDAIEMSAVEEVRPDVSLPQTLSWRLRCRAIKPVRSAQMRCVIEGRRLRGAARRIQRLKAVFLRAMTVHK